MNEQNTQGNTKVQNLLAKVKSAKKVLLTIAIVVVVGILGYFGKGLVVAAVINGKPIYRLQVVRVLEKAQGAQALDNLVTESLIRQEAAKKNITVSKEEVAADIATIKQQLSASGVSYETALKDRGLTQKDVEDQVTVKKMIEKLLGNQVQVTDKEVSDYIAANQKYLTGDTTTAAFKESIKQQLISDKLDQLYQAWVKDLKAKAKIMYFTKY